MNTFQDANKLILIPPQTNIPQTGKNYLLYYEKEFYLAFKFDVLSLCFLVDDISDVNAFPLNLKGLKYWELPRKDLTSYYYKAKL